MPRRSSLTLACVCALGLATMTSSALAQQATGESIQLANEALVALRSGDVSVREEALRILIQLGKTSRPLLVSALDDPDPDVRFHVLHAIQAIDLRIERILRVIVEGHTGDSGTYPSALRARQELLGLAGPGTRRELARIVARFAPEIASSPRSLRYVTVALDLLAETYRKGDKSEFGQEDAELLVDLTRYDLGEGCYELALALMNLPWDRVLAVAQPVLEGEGPPIQRARLIRVLAGAVRGPDAIRLAPPAAKLLKDDDPQVRLAAIVALDTIGLPDGAAVPVVRQISDRDPKVRSEALGVSAVRRLAAGRAAAEKVALDENLSYRLRQQAVRLLGRVGDSEAAPALRRLIEVGSRDPSPYPRELTELAGWALGSVGAPDAVQQIEALLGDERFAGSKRLMVGLGQFGGQAGIGALARRLNNPYEQTQALLALGRVKRADIPLAERVVYEAGMRRITSKSLTNFGNALVDLAGTQGLLRKDGSARDLLARLFRNVPEGANEAFAALFEPVGQGGVVPDPQLRHEVAINLITFSERRTGGLLQMMQSADTLARVDPELARIVLKELLDQNRGLAFGNDWWKLYVRSLARSLARTGVNATMRRDALSFSLAELEDADPSQRGAYMNDVGIDYLYLKDLERANVTFRQMLWSNPEEDISSYNLACGHSLGGEVDEALLYLRRSIRSGYDDARHMRSDSDLYRLHPDSRFQRLLTRMLLSEEIGLPAPQDSFPR